MSAQPLKLVFAGPVGAGKTTAIAAIADAPPVSTDTPMSEGPMGAKTTTTVAFDFATLKTEEGDPVFLYGLPGQERFDFMRRIILNGALGVVLALNGANTDIADQCTHWLMRSWLSSPSSLFPASHRRGCLAWPETKENLPCSRRRTPTHRRGREHVFRAVHIT